MDFEGYDVVFWTKLAIVSIPLIILMWYMAPTLKWKILFTPCVIVGAWLALAGKSARKR